MFLDDRKQALPRAVVGGLLGAAGYLLLSFVTQPGALFGGSLELDFTFCFNAQVPEALGAALGLLLWAAFGAEIGLATLPFADDGPALVRRTLVHLLAMAATVSAWSLLNFRPVEVLAFLVPLVLVYLLVWLGRWVGWYVEAAAIRERLGLSPGPSLFHWRETLPYVPFAALLCLVLPLVLRWIDMLDVVPVLSGLLYPWLLLPVGAFCSGLSLGKRQGLCPLYPALCVLGILIFIPLARLFSNMYDWPMVTIALVSSLAGDLAGWAWRRRRRSPPPSGGPKKEV